MIFAASFAGEHAERDARELVDELRKEYRLNAYLHKKRFDFSDSVEGLGLDEYGNRKSMRFNADSAFDEIAVLVGDYTSLDDPALQKHLQKVKYARPDCLSLRKDGRPTTQRFAGLRALQQRLNRDEEKRRKGPMGSAFATRNPRLPREYFEPDGLDDLLVSMNQGRKYSLLDCPGKYTVRVASFRGNVVIDQREVQAIESGRRMKSKLDDAAIKAQRMVELLRGRGDEAYVFHDRHESIVTVGSFQSVGNKLADGRIDLNPAIHGIMERYGPQRQPLRGQDGTALAGIQPRSLKGLPFDVQPLPVLVPRRSVAADYATTR
jgi:hypothetical protein